MNELYHVEGILNKGFVGQITYMVCLEKPCDKLDIHFSFDKDKRTYREEEVTPELIREVTDDGRYTNNALAREIPEEDAGR